MTAGPPAFAAVRAMPVRQVVEWAFGVECAQLSLPDRRTVEERGFGFGMEYLLIERARVGCQIDGGRGGFEPQIHEDAEAVAARLVCLPQALGGLSMAIRVAELARGGQAPDWMPGARSQLVPRDWIVNRHGRHPKTEIVSYAKVLNRGRWRHHEVRCTPVTLDPHPARIEAARLAWSRWVAALRWLRDDLRTARLREHTLTNTLPPDDPWRNE